MLKNVYYKCVNSKVFWSKAVIRDSISKRLHFKIEWLIYSKVLSSLVEEM